MCRKRSTKIGKTWRKKSKRCVPTGLLDEYDSSAEYEGGTEKWECLKKVDWGHMQSLSPNHSPYIKKKKKKNKKSLVNARENLKNDIQQSGSDLQENVMGGHFSTSNTLSREVRPRGTPTLEANS